MRRVLVVAIASAAGCYRPSPPANVPCAPPGAASRCPSGQECIDEVCVPEGTAEVDAALPPPVDDEDADGVADDEDNCPAVANADQANEDGDRFGDRCDGCPPLSDNSPVDDDGDGVENDCDPNPQSPGDVIVMFEGFGMGIPANWQVTGAWTANDGAVAVAPAVDEVVMLRPPVAPDATSTSSTSVVPLANPGSGGIGIVAPVSESGDGLTCLFFYPVASPSDQRAGLVRSSTLAVAASAAYDWVVGDAYRFVERIDGGRYTCDVVANEGPSLTFDTGDENQMPVPDPPGLSVFSRGIAGRFEWVMHVDSP